MQKALVGLMLAIAIIAASAKESRAFDLQISIGNLLQFTPNQLQIVQEKERRRAERMWETVITGYAPGINIASLPISIYPNNSGLAAAIYDALTVQGGYTLSTSGYMYINTLEIENFANWQGDEPNGLNFIDEVMAHEIGHVLGIGTLWVANNVYVDNTFQYTGQYGAAAYAEEFSDSILYAPVENAGTPGTPNAHWDQRMRSSSLEGNPSNPWSLDPRVGAVDAYNRDRSLELMTGGIDPDWREPFLARFTVQSMRDLGYTVAEFEDFNGDGAIDGADLAILQTNFGATGLQIDSMAFGDADRDRDVDSNDLLLWQRAVNMIGGAAAVPEPGTAALAALAMLAGARVSRWRADRR